MVDKIQPRSTWPRVTSTVPVKKIDRRRDQQDDKKFQEHLAEKDASADSDEKDKPDPATGDTSAAKKGKNTDAVAPAKQGKRIDIIV
jgi:hypothetical protein